MSRALEPVVPAPLTAALADAGVAAAEGFTLQLMTVRADGWPHMALLSVGEVVALDDRRLRLAVWPGSTSAANLAARPRATLAAVLAPTCFVVRARVTPLGEVERLAAFEARVEEVAADEAPYAVLEAGVRYRLTDRHATLSRWERTRQALREVGT